MAIQVVTDPALLDSTGQGMITAMNGIANAVQPINIYLDVNVSIPVNGWSQSEPHVYNWLYNRITESCGIEVYFADGAEDVDMRYVEYDKIAGGIRFTIDQIPDKAIPLVVRIINAQTTAVIDPVDSTLVTEDAVSGAVNVHEAIANHESRISTNEDDIDEIKNDISDIDDELALRLKSVNGIAADEHGNVDVNETEFTHQIVTEDAQQSTGEFLFRTTGGDASLSDGPAKLVSISGRRVHTGIVNEQIDMEVNAVERTAPDPITAELDQETFEAYVSGAGVYTLVYTNEWSESPTLYGVTVTGNPMEGDRISISWNEISDPTMSVYAPRTAPEAITATINEATFREAVSDSATITFIYTSSWNLNPATYGITVSNEPVNGDEIVVTYVKSSRGTITVSNPNKFISTGWNLYDNSTGKKYAKVKKYSTTYGFLIGGSYATLQFSATLDGEKTTITPASGYFTIPSDGYVFVTGGDTTTYIMMTWSDWTEGYEGEFKSYEESVVNLATIMTNFPYGLMQVGAVSDEINFSMMRAISRIERMAYSDANLEYVKESGRAYEADTSYIYVVKDAEDVYTITETGAYTACDHGNEIIEGGTVEVAIETLYGQNLVDKLRTDVLTKSVDLVNNLTTNDSTKALSAAQGYALNSNVTKLNTMFSIEVQTLSDAKTALLSLAQSMKVNEIRPVHLKINTTNDYFEATRIYGGDVYIEYKTNDNSQLYFSCNLVSYKGALVTIGYGNGTWYFDAISNNITIHDLGSQTNETDFNNAIKAVCNSANTNSPYWVKITHTYAASGVFDYAHYTGYVVKDKSTYGWNIHLFSDVNNVDGYYNSNTSALTWKDNFNNNTFIAPPMTSDYTLLHGGYIKTGKIVYVHMIIKATGGSYTIATNLPVPKIYNTSSGRGAYIPNNINKNITVNSNSALYIGESLSANTEFIVTGTYICE